MMALQRIQELIVVISSSLDLLTRFNSLNRRVTGPFLGICSICSLSRKISIADVFSCGVGAHSQVSDMEGRISVFS